MSLRILCAGLTVLGSAPLLAQEASNDPAGNWAAIARCGTIEGAEARHRCTDDVLKRAGVLTAARVEKETREAFGRNERAQPRTPTPRPATAPAVAQAEQEEERDELLTTIKAVRVVGYRNVQVITADGSVWEQTQGKTFTSDPKVGDPFSVIRAAMGSYRCRFANSSRYRCERKD